MNMTEKQGSAEEQGKVETKEQPTGKQENVEAIKRPAEEHCSTEEPAAKQVKVANSTSETKLEWSARNLN